MILEGIDEETIAEKLNAEAAQITAAEDELVTKFIGEELRQRVGSWRVHDDYQSVQIPHSDSTV